MNVYALDAGKVVNYILDGVVVLGILITMIVMGRRGFINSVFKILSTIAAFVGAILLAKVLVSATDGLFGLEDKLIGGLEKAFSKMKGFDADISDQGLEAALKEQNVSAILGRLVLKIVGKDASLAPGTTLASLIGKALGSFATLLLTGVLIFLIIKIVLSLIGRILSAGAESSEALGGVNTLFGALFGCAYAIVIIGVVLAIFTILPIQAITNFFSKSVILGFLYEHNPVIYLLSLFL